MPDIKDPADQNSQDSALEKATAKAASATPPEAEPVPEDLHDLVAAQAQHPANHHQGAAHHRPPTDRTITLALAGNPNSGKTTAFNRYTGSRQHVANYPGITVDRKIGNFKFHGHKVRLIDLPGTYSLTAYSQDELVARRSLSEDNPDCVIDIINASAIERNLYLAVQIMEMGIPVVLALNMYDEARAQGMDINHARLSELMGVPVVPTVARNGEGLMEAMGYAVDISLDRYELSSGGSAAPTPLNQAYDSKEPDQGGNTASGQNRHNPKTMPQGQRNNTPLVISYGTDLEPVIDEISALISGAGLFSGLYPARWVAVKHLENDAEIREKTRLADPALADKIENIVSNLAKHLEQTLQTYPEAVIADYRYGYINSILKQGVITRKSDLKARLDRSDRMDKVLTHRLFGPLIMIGVIYLMYKITFSVGEIPAGWLEAFFGWLNETVSNIMPDGMLKSLVVSGIIDGVGGVLGFVPLILIMFLLISALEDSGYMARVAYMLDRIFRAFGLHGYSVMPFIISGGIAGGCGVPGAMATRTLRSPKEKLATLVTLPFMTCGAKLPVFLLLAAAFFPGQETAVMMTIWLVAWVSALLVARLLRSTLLKGDSTPFVMELPPYRVPTLFGVLIHTWERIWQYVKKAGTVILAISVIVWASMTFPQLPEELAAPYQSRIAAAEEAIAAAETAGADEAAPVINSDAEAEALAAADADATEESEEEDPLQAELYAAESALAAAGLEYSYAGRVGRALEGVTRPAGFDWRTNIALVAGIGAKEVVVSTLGTAYSLGEVDPEESESLSTQIANDPHWNKANAAALMIFTLLYAPCFVAMVVIGQEAGSWKWSVFVLVFNTLLAFVAAVAVYQIGLLLI